jgi:hypothetical protein
MILNSDLEEVYELNIMTKQERLSMLLEVGMWSSQTQGVKNSGFG